MGGRSNPKDFTLEIIGAAEAIHDLKKLPNSNGFFDLLTSLTRTAFVLSIECQ